MAVELLTVEEVAKRLRLHEMTVRRHIKQGKLRAVRVGGRIRVPGEEVQRFMQPLPARPSIHIPPAEPPSPEEIARRRALFDEVMRLREKMEPLGMSTAELIRQARLEEEEALGG